jgi:O-succinylbenzoic acid--CoA ligase
MVQPNQILFSKAPTSNTFLSEKARTFTYEDLYSFSNLLNTKALSKDKPLIIFTENRAETVFAIAASFLLEIPIIPVSPDIEEQRLIKICKDLSPAAYVAQTARNEACLKDLQQIFIDVDSLKSGDSFSPEPVSKSFTNSMKCAGYLQTSGSTASPKIVPILRRQFFSAAHASKQNFKPAKNKYWLLCLPMNHIGGISVIIRSLLYHSAVYLVPEFDTLNIRSLLNNNKQFEAASMVPTMLERLLEDSFFRVQYNFKALLLGGGPISPDLISRSLTRGIPIVTSYGMTETCAQIAANPMLRSGGMYIPKKSVGRVFEPNEIDIRDDNGNSLPYLESGQIWLKGPQVFDGYHQEELNSAAFDSDGWFNTGDFGHINRKKHLFVESRRTDLIISGGENISPVEVEDALKKLGIVNDAAVVGVPDREWGQKAVAFISTEDQQAVDPDGLRIQLKEVLQSFKIPKEFVVIDEIPKTSTGKIRRKELRDRYLKK